MRSKTPRKRSTKRKNVPRSPDRENEGNGENKSNVEVEFDLSDAQCAEMVLDLIKTLQAVRSQKQLAPTNSTRSIKKKSKGKKSKEKHVDFDTHDKTEDEPDHEAGDTVESPEENKDTTEEDDECKNFKSSHIKLKAKNSEKDIDAKRVKKRISESCKRMKKTISKEFAMKEKLRHKEEKENLKRLKQLEKDKQRALSKSAKEKIKCEKLKEKMRQKTEKKKLKDLERKLNAK
ncbi:hypothetical protein WDU94_007897 [Cyamophila willieti]